jgi:hypothetical protein
LLCSQNLSKRSNHNLVLSIYLASLYITSVSFQLVDLYLARLSLFFFPVASSFQHCSISACLAHFPKQASAGPSHFPLYLTDSWVPPVRAPFHLPRPDIAPPGQPVRQLHPAYTRALRPHYVPINDAPCPCTTIARVARVRVPVVRYSILVEALTAAPLPCAAPASVARRPPLVTRTPPATRT